MTKEIRSSNVERRSGVRSGVRHSDLELPFMASTPFLPCVETLNLVGSPKRRSGRALQNLADLRALVPTRQRLGVRRCSAAFDGRVDFELASAVHGKPLRVS